MAQHGAFRNGTQVDADVDLNTTSTQAGLTDEAAADVACGAFCQALVMRMRGYYLFRSLIINQVCQLGACCIKLLRAIRLLGLTHVWRLHNRAKYVNWAAFLGYHTFSVGCETFSSGVEMFG